MAGSSARLKGFDHVSMKVLQVVLQRAPERAMTVADEDDRP
jgi:hypothetical protein